MINTDISENVEKVRFNIAEAAKRAGRRLDEITLIGVSKTVDVPRIKQAVAAGITELGENRVQELCDKYPEFEGVNWHLIGHLQTNKVKYIVDKVKLIHSVDSIKLADEINHQAGLKGVTASILLEVNVSGEESKFGIKPDEAVRFAEYIAGFRNTRLLGLMTVPPPVINPQDNKKYFNELFELSVKISAEGYDNVKMNVLSMGMSGDYTAAIECGATMVRVGSAIFGNRIYKGGTR